MYFHQILIVIVLIIYNVHCNITKFLSLKMIVSVHFIQKRRSDLSYNITPFKLCKVGEDMFLFVCMSICFHLILIL